MTRATRSTNSTSPSAIYSEPRLRRPGATAGQRVRLVASLIALALVAAGGANAKVFLTVEEGLALAFPGCTTTKRTFFLTQDQMTRARTFAGTTIESAVVHPYEAACEGSAESGVAFLDTHRVRTMAETLLVVIAADGTIRRLEILAFREPEEYIPRTIWYEQFTGRDLAPELALKREIRGVTGATLTAHATTDAVRRVLALHRILYLDNESAEAAP